MIFLILALFPQFYSKNGPQKMYLQKVHFLFFLPRACFLFLGSSLREGKPKKGIGGGATGKIQEKKPKETQKHWHQMGLEAIFSLLDVKLSSGQSRMKLGRPLKTTFDMTTLIFSSGGCPSYPFYPLKRVPSYPFLAENPSSEGATLKTT